ncbi:alpha-N-acetylglucosaminidase family / NAGLU family [Prunus dulcis]|uniref:Alpha-N-acetylglucosaminidase family / NAGLU family n=1 Tax=Prunus dulcis TaxID=3755 RepID=A0A4Y1RIX8_PRUDU|nr:alpha-N-acetylglucosaminidase family / NAGLU family [Prunus dulcis]
MLKSFASGIKQKPPKGPRPFGALVSAYGKLYYLASPKCDSSLPEPFFEMYDPSIDRWDEVPCSYPFICEHWAEYWDDLDIVGYVVCYGFILFSMCDLNQSRAQVMAFDMDEGDEGCTACSLSKPLILPGLEIIDWPFKYGLTEYLVHLGNHDFCHVRTGEQKNCTDRQYICITMFQIVVGEGGSHIKTLNSTICAVDVKDSISFLLNFSFSPESDDFEPEDERMTAMKARSIKAEITSTKKAKQQENRIHGKCKENITDYPFTSVAAPPVEYVVNLHWVGKPICWLPKEEVGLVVRFTPEELSPIKKIPRLRYDAPSANVSSFCLQSWSLKKAKSASVEDMDTLLACHDGFLLGPWLESAKKLAQDEEQEKQFEWNARTQITLWFDNTKEEASLLRDYGNKYWSGLLQNYYGRRAAIYFKYLTQSLEEGSEFRLKDRRREWIKLTNNWQNSRKAFPVKSSGNALNTSRWLFDKYLGSSADNIQSLNEAAIEIPLRSEGLSRRVSGLDILTTSSQVKTSSEAETDAGRQARTL